MPRSKEALYRHVVRDAFQHTWNAKRIWPVALGAGILLSGSIYDVVWKLLNALSPQTSLSSVLGFFGRQAISSWSHVSFIDLLLGGVQVFQLTALLLIIGFAVAAISVICQGALVFFLGNARSRRSLPSVKEALSVGAHAFWPVFVLNLLVMVVLGGTRSILAMTLAMAAGAGTAGLYFLYIAAFIVFATLAVVAVILQIFALHAMILQGATLMQALERAGRLLQSHWVITAETGLLLFVLSLGAGILFTAAVIVVMVPLFLVMVIGAVLGVSAFVNIALYVGIGMLLLALIALGAALVTLQYATWGNLYHRIGEGGALPKLHRWFRQFVHGFHVPGS